MADFRTAVNITMDPEHEGGFQKDPDDSGNWTGGEIGVGLLKGTKYGISAAQFPDLDIENLTTDEAAALYQDRYWKPLYSQIDSQIVANKLFDLGVLFGVGEAVKLLQITLQPQYKSVVVDGAFGPNTLAIVNQVDGESLLNAYKTALVAYTLRVALAKPNDKKFVAGWVKRINS